MVVVVSPFVGAHSQRDNAEVLSDILQNSIENRFIQNQLIRKGTSLAGVGAIAAGSKMIAVGESPRSEFRSHIQSKREGQRQAYKFERKGTTYGKPLKRGFGNPATPRYGHYIDDHRNRTGRVKRSPGLAKGGRLLTGLGRASVGIGIGLVGYNIHRHGVEETVVAEVSGAYAMSPLGMVDQQLTGGAVTNLGQSSAMTYNVAQLAIVSTLGGML